MPTTRPRRIVRLAVMALAVVVSLPVWYLASVSMALITMTAFGGVPAPVGSVLNAFLVPLNKYLTAHGPGYEQIGRLIEWSVETGIRWHR